jgi:hypothetical protein
MQGMFEVRYKSLQDSIKAVYERVRRDELLATMLNDHTSATHIEERVE